MAGAWWRDGDCNGGNDYKFGRICEYVPNSIPEKGDVSSCHPDCLANPCLNGGNCLSSGLESSYCQCDNDHVGLRCEFDWEPWLLKLKHVHTRMEINANISYYYYK